MHVLIDSAVVNLFQWINLDKRIYTTVVSLQAHLSIEVNESFKVIEYSELITVLTCLIQRGDAYELGSGVDFLLKDFDFVLT